MNQPLIIHLQPYLNKSCGITRMINQIVVSTSSEFHHVIITHGGDNIESFFHPDIRIIQFEKHSPVLEFIKLYALLKRLTKDQKSVVINSYHRLFDLLTFFIPLPDTVKKVTNVHSVVFGKKLISYFSNYYIVPSFYVAQHLTNYFNIPPNKITVIPNGINPAKYNTVKKVTVNRESNNLIVRGAHPVIAFIGRIDKEKGIDVLIESAKELWSKGYTFSLNIFGNGPEVILLSEIITQNKFPIFWSGSVNEVEEIYRNTDIIILPSRIDPFPLVMLEAGYFSKPFIGTYSGGMSEVIQNGINGLIVPPDDTKALTEAVEFFLLNPESAKRCGRELNKIVLEKYSLENCLKLYKQYYYSLFGITANSEN